MMLSIVSAKYVAPLSVELEFNDGVVKRVDVGTFIRNHPTIEVQTGIFPGMSYSSFLCQIRSVFSQN